MSISLSLITSLRLQLLLIVNLEIKTIAQVWRWWVRLAG